MVTISFWLMGKVGKGLQLQAKRVYNIIVTTCVGPAPMNIITGYYMIK